MTRNYIIAVDENGQPFIAHAFGDSPGYGRQKKHHKYIARVRERNKWKYFYTLNEYEAYMRNLRDSNSKDYKIANKSFQMNPNADKEFSEKEINRIELASDAKRKMAEHKYREALRRAERILNSNAARPEDKKLAEDQLEKALREYELMRDIM